MSVKYTVDFTTAKSYKDRLKAAQKKKAKAKEAESTIKCDTINALPLPLEEIDSTSSSCDVEEDGTNSQLTKKDTNIWKRGSAI